MSRLIGLVKPLSGYMVLAVGLGVLGRRGGTGVRGRGALSRIRL